MVLRTVSVLTLLCMTVALGACGGDSSRRATPSTTPGTTATATTTTIPSSTAEPPASPTFTASAAPVRHALATGDAVPTDNGLLYIRIITGQMVFWELPGPYLARPISRDGRWVAWSAQGSNGRWRLLDTATGSDRLLSLAGEGATAAGFSRDGATMVLESGSQAALAETASLRILAQAPVVSSARNGVAEFSIDGTAALAFGGPTDAQRATVILRPDGSTTTIAGVSWPLRWSADGRSLAVTTAGGTRIVSGEGATKLEIPFGNVEHGYNPRWSPDGRYIAIANAYNVGGERVFDAATGAELLRITGSPTCLGDYWLAETTLAYGYGSVAIAVPSGEKVQAPASAKSSGFTFDQSAGVGTTRLLLDTGGSVEFRSGTPWSDYYDGDGVYQTTTDGRALFLIGIGGKGLCDGPMDELSVQLPPFR